MGKFKENAKKVEGRERKEAAATAKAQKKQEELEKKAAKEWQVGAKDTHKKEEEEAKRLEKLEKKRERERLEAIESASIKSKVPTKSLSVSRSPSSPFSSTASTKSKLESSRLSLEPLNRPSSVLSSKSSQKEDTISEYSASNLDDAILLLEGTNTSSDKLALDRHPERRVKAAFAIYEQREMSILKLENPGLRLSQLREILRKNWAKAPENPFNQASIAFNASREEELEAAKEHVERKLDQFRIQ